MKKTYILPQTWAVDIHTEQMLALSMGVNKGGETVGSDDEWLTRQKDFEWQGNATWEDEE